MSKPTNLRPEAGGNPARSNSTGVKNNPASPGDGNQFPDAPEQDPDDKPQDKPDLDAFAKRIGTDTIETGERLDAVPKTRSTDSDGVDSRLIIAAGGAVVAGLLTLVMWRRKRRGLLSKAVALGAVANIIKN